MISTRNQSRILAATTANPSQPIVSIIRTGQEVSCDRVVQTIRMGPGGKLLGAVLSFVEIDRAMADSIEQVPRELIATHYPIASVHLIFFPF